MEGDRLANHTDAPPSYIPNLDPGRFGGGTYTSQQVEPTLEAYENIFGPSARDIKQDLQRFKRHGRWHLPDILKGPNQYLTDRIDGLITDAASSPFTSRILPYKYITNVDGKIKWNVWSFDEGLSSRVPYESAARTLTQSKRSYAGYTIRQGMAIVLEHNFMMTEAGRTNFRNQLNQLIGSIQLTNDLDVHVALVLAPSYQKTMQEKYLTNDKTPTQICREFVDMFGFVQKNQNALDILIEEAKGLLKTWGAPMPNFMLCNSKLTFQLTMIPDVTNYVANGPEGAKRLRSGPDMGSYRGISIIHTRAFSMETGAPPRDILRRRVRVAEYYRILPHRDNHKRLFQLYNEERDTWSTFTFGDLLLKSLASAPRTALRDVTLPGVDNSDLIRHATIGLSGHAGAAAGAHGLHPGAAPALGIALQNPPDALTASMTELYKQIFAGRTRSAEFIWQPQFIHSNIVYAPGAIDRSRGDAYDNYVLQGPFDALPAFIKAALVEKREADLAALAAAAAVAGGGAAAALATDTQKNTVSFQIQSVSQYPRNVEQFIASIRAGAAGTYAAFPLPACYNAAAPPIAGGNPIALARLNVALGTRNYMRYGVPNDNRRPEVAWGGTCREYREVFDLNHAPNTFNPLNQHLRNLGAFYSPNHFKGPHRIASPPFTRLGNLFGFNMLLSVDTINSLTFEHARLGGTDSPYTGTVLYDVVTNPAKYDALLNEITADLLAAKAQCVAAAAGGVRPPTRSLLGQALSRAVRGHFAARAPTTGYNAPSKTAADAMIYWLWPGGDDVTDDVFASADQWAVAARGSANFDQTLDLTDAVVDAIELTPAGHVTTAVVDPTGLPDPTREDAIQFVNMLAWRLWADQEYPLESVYHGAGPWPSPAQYLSPPRYPYPNFGGTVMYQDVHAGVAPGPVGAQQLDALNSDRTKDIEVVIVRPNIEHYMLGIILGQGGESLGSTFWGQTELSCYDDSQHGIWGMSYKYNERAIVINERNLVRLWDIAYDGYVGGKEDTAVDWDDDDEQHPNSAATLAKQTMDVTQAYRGPSMLVMAFDHRQAKTNPQLRALYQNEFKTNWPSPIVFYDRMDANQPVTLPMDFDNIHVTEAGQFRVFNKDIYKNAYAAYREKMPNFWELHKIRKNAGLAAVENEVSSEALAFQGTMRTLNAENGQVVSETMGSGHHGPDFVGAASLRAGKGYKINSQPTLQRTI